jgi:hypothetical protein
LAFANTDLQAVQQKDLFDDLVGAQQDGRWHCKAERLGGVGVQGHFESDGQLHGQVCRPCTVENAIDMDASMKTKPVTLPPGRARVATKPWPTGSDTITKTIGTVWVSRCRAAVTGLL